MTIQDVTIQIKAAAALIRSARFLTAFTGAGISVESGIPPFRGPGGLWGKYDPHTLELDYFRAHPDTAWPVIREIFCDNFGRAKPNRAHEVLAAGEGEAYPRGDGTVDRGHLKTLITQSIDPVQRNRQEALSNSLLAWTSFSGSTEQRAKNASSKNVLCDAQNTEI